MKNYTNHRSNKVHFIGDYSNNEKSPDNPLSKKEKQQVPPLKQENHSKPILALNLTKIANKDVKIG